MALPILLNGYENLDFKKSQANRIHVPEKTGKGWNMLTEWMTTASPKQLCNYEQKRRRGVERPKKIQVTS